MTSRHPSRTPVRVPGQGLLSVLSLLLLATAPALGAADRFWLRPALREVDLPAAGVTLKPLRDFSQLPWPTPQIVTYQRSDGGESFEACDPREAFVAGQVLAAFVGDVGRLIVATVRDAPPGPDWPLINGQHVRCDALAELRAQRSFGGRPEDVGPWLEAFTGWPLAREERIPADSGLRTPARWFLFESRQPGTRQAIVLAPPGSRPPVALIVDLNERGEYRDLTKGPLAVAASTRFVTLRAEDKRASARLHGDAPATPGAGGRADDQALADAKARVIQQIGNLQDWWYIELPHYILTSNMSQRDRRLVTLIQEDIEQVRTLYAGLIPPRVPVREVSVVRVFRERSEYLDYIPPEMSWSGGIWMPGKKELVISPIDTRRASQDRRLTLQVVYHEAFHQYIFYALGGRPLPPWFDEGHACLFEGSDTNPRGKTAAIAENEARTKRFLARLEARQPLQLGHLLRLDLAAFYRNQPEDNYATACALVYFLRKAYPQFPGRGYDTLCSRILDAVISAPPGGADAAVEGVLATVDLRQLERDLAEFWTSSTKRGRAGRFAGFGTDAESAPAAAAAAR